MPSKLAIDDELMSRSPKYPVQRQKGDKKGLDAMGHRLDPAIRNRISEAFDNLTDALDQSAVNHFPMSTEYLQDAADEAMRAVARLKLELHAR